MAWATQRSSLAMAAGDLPQTAALRGWPCRNGLRRPTAKAALYPYHFHLVLSPQSGRRRAPPKQNKTNLSRNVNMLARLL